MSDVIKKEIDLNGRPLKLETGFLAQQADAAVMGTWGETVVLATVASKPLAEDLGYFPLSVEYVEKYYAGGRITAQKFIKRETRPSDEAVLNGRAIDRSIRPLFPQDFHHEVQVIVTVLSFDGVNDPLTVGFIATSAALAISSIPWNGPLSIARVGAKVGTWVVNPVLGEIEHLDLEVFVASSREKIVMIEAEADEMEDSLVLEGIRMAQTQSQPVIGLIEEFIKEAGRSKQSVTTLSEAVDEKLLSEVKKKAKLVIEAGLFDTKHPWHETTGDQIKSELASAYSKQLTPQQISTIFDKVAKEIMQDAVLNQGKRVDGRGMEEVREVTIQTGVLPRTHGSAVFQRGNTQVLAVATLGPLSASQTLEGMSGESLKRFMHHYNMSSNPFSTGEPKKLGSPNRRDIGHGSLVEKGIVRVLPLEDEFPYAIRVVSEVLAANASTSMASACATTLALLNAGVPLKNPVAGIALGLLSSGDKFQVITDMQATEDFYGEMDFKITGTPKGITAVQMDTKLEGLNMAIIEEALRQGKKAREFILEKINAASPKALEISKYAPKIEVTHIKPEEIGLLIGPGGKNINGIIAKTGAQIDIEDDGTVMISSMSEESIKQALSAVQGMFKKFEVGEEYAGKVVRIAPFGAFVEIAPGKDGLVHISQMAPHRVERPEDVVSEGQEVKVRVTDVSPDGKIGLSMLFGEDRKPESEGRPAGASRGGFGGRQGFGAERRGRGFGGGPSRFSGGVGRRNFSDGDRSPSGPRDRFEPGRSRGGFNGRRGGSPAGRQGFDRRRH